MTWSLTWSLTWALSFVVVLAEFALPSFIGSGFDASWQAVSGQALGSSAFSVRDIVSTVGPFSPIHTGYFVREFYPVQFVLSSVVAAAYAWASVRIFYGPFGVSDGPRPGLAAFATIILVQVFVMAFGWRNLLLHVIGLYVGLGYVIAARSRWSDSAFAGFGALAVAILCLAKLSAVASASVALLIIDLWRMAVERRLPIALPAFAAAITVLVLGAGYHVTDLPTWLRLHGEIIAGYSGTMVIAGPPLELVAFVAVAAALVFSVFRSATWTALDGFSLRKRAIVALLYAGILFAVFKAGFVRADLHTLVSWGCVAAMLPPLGGLQAGSRPARAGGRLSTLAMMAALLGVMVTAIIYKGGIQSSALSHLFLQRVVLKTTSLASFAVAPHAWLDRNEQAQNDAFRLVANDMPLPDIKGSLDSIPTIQSAIIAHRLDYRPRPSFQQYNTSGPHLVAANKAYYRSSGRPDHVLFFPESIDNWYPNLAEGACWEELVRYYEPSSRFQQFLVLSRRSTELGPILTAIGSRNGKLGQPLDLSGIPATVFAKIHIRDTLLGTVKRPLFRASDVFIRVGYRDGGERSYKLVPSIAAEGFLLSPTISTGAEFAALALGTNDGLKTVRSITIESPGLLSLNYASDFSLELFAVDTSGFKPNGKF